MESSVPESLSLTIIGGTSATLSRTVSLTSLQRSKALGTGTVGGFTLSYTLNGVSNVGTPVQGHITIPVTVHGGLPSSLTVRGVSVTIPPSPYYVGDVISNPTITVQATGSGVMQGHVLVDGSLSWSSTPSFTVSISGSAFVTSGSGYEEYSFSGTATLRLPSLGGAELEPESREARNGMVASLINRGAQYFTERNEQAAEDHFLRALALDPASVPALRNLGILKLQRDDLEKAAAYLEKARSLAPQDAQVQSLFVRLREEEGNSAALMRELQRFVSLQPRNPEAWAKLGILYEQHEDRRQAEQAFIEAERQQTVEPYPYYWLARERKDANLAHLAAGKAVQKAGLLRLQAAQAIEQKEGELGERELNLLKELSVKIGEPLTVLGDTLALLEELHPDPDAFREDLVLLNEWYPHSVELKEALA